MNEQSNTRTHARSLPRSHARTNEWNENYTSENERLHART